MRSDKVFDSFLKDGTIAVAAGQTQRSRRAREPRVRGVGRRTGVARRGHGALGGRRNLSARAQRSRPGAAADSRRRRVPWPRPALRGAPSSRTRARRRVSATDDSGRGHEPPEFNDTVGRRGCPLVRSDPAPRPLGCSRCPCSRRLHWAEAATSSRWTTRTAQRSLRVSLGWESRDGAE